MREALLPGLYEVAGDYRDVPAHWVRLFAGMRREWDVMWSLERHADEFSREIHGHIRHMPNVSCTVRVSTGALGGLMVAVTDGTQLLNWHILSSELEACAAMSFHQAMQHLLEPLLARIRLEFNADTERAPAAAAVNSQPATEREVAEGRGMKLLYEHLTPTQAHTYSAKGYFDVTGGDSGKTYRIRKASTYNVVELDESGHIALYYCFLPVGGLVIGDVLLAQKISLEVDEKAALKIANKVGAPRPTNQLAGMQGAGGGTGGVNYLGGLTGAAALQIDYRRIYGTLTTQAEYWDDPEPCATDNVLTQAYHWLTRTR